MSKIRVIFFIFLIFSIVGCTGERCIEADNFGHISFTVQSRYTDAQLQGQTNENQIAPWIDSKYYVNGKILTIVVKGWDYGVEENNTTDVSAWCPWYGSQQDGGKLAPLCARFLECRFIDDKCCTDTPDARIYNAPCIFKNGMGLYALISDKNTDPNESLFSMQNPTGISFHLGEKTDSKIYELDKMGRQREVNGRSYEYSAADSQKYANGKLYFKILDKFYGDNSGQYKVVIKSGVGRTDEDPTARLEKIVQEFLFGKGGDDYGLVRNLYIGLVKNSGYKFAVSAMLSLYIMYTALSYLAGNITLTHTELLIRVMKIALISILLKSDQSWYFFNNYLFAYFIGGIDQIRNMIAEAATSGPGSSSVLALMLAPETNSKLFSLLFVDWLGIVYIILFYYALYFLMSIFFKATIISISCLIFIGMIITMAPIFICFMLFDVTKSLFENWLKQLISYAIQPIILFTGLTFISLLIRQEIYGSLGFRICKQNLFNMAGGSSSVFSKKGNEGRDANLSQSLFYWWFPQPMKGEKFNRTTEAIRVPIDHFTITADGEEKFCEAYQCIEERYTDLPFIDPVADSRRLTQFWNGKFVQFDGLLLIFAMIYLLNKFNELTASISRFITDSSGNTTNLGGARDNAAAGMKSMFKSVAKGTATRVADRTIGKERREALTKTMTNLSKMTPSAIVDKIRIDRLKKEALSSGANKILLQEAERKSGIKQSDLKTDHIKIYESKLKDVLGKVDEKTVRSLAKKNIDELKDELAQAQHGKGKKYSQLSTAEKEKIDAKHDTLKPLAKEAAAARKLEQKLQEAYIDAYSSMSDKNIGVLGKTLRPLRALQETKYKISNSIKRELNAKQEKRIAATEELYADYKGMAGGFYKAVTGRDKENDPWHSISTNKKDENYRKQTYAEIIEERKILRKQEEREKVIRPFLYKASPEIVAKAAQRNGPDSLKQFRELEREYVKNNVYSTLSGTEDPAILGKKYLSEYAKDSEMRHAIDRAYELGKKAVQNDDYISKEKDYEAASEKCAKIIKENYELLKKHHNKEDIKTDDLPQLLTDYHKSKGAEITESGISAKMKELRELQEAIKEFKEIEQILQQIDIRKQEYNNEIEAHVSEINKYRTNANMEIYKPKIEEGTRRVRKIDDYVRGK